MQAWSRNLSDHRGTTLRLEPGNNVVNVGESAFNVALVLGIRPRPEGFSG